MKKRPRTYKKGTPCKVLVSSTEKRLVNILIQLNKLNK